MSENVNLEEVNQGFEQNTVQETPDASASVTEVGETNESKKSFMEGKKKLILAVAAVVLAIAIGLGMYKSPANQLSRQLNLGQKYLEEENYEQAVVAFLKAIEIDDKCMEAYLGCITAYTENGESEELAAIYEQALEAVGGLGEAALNENMETVVSIYLAAEKAYDDPEKLAM